MLRILTWNLGQFEKSREAGAKAPRDAAEEISKAVTAFLSRDGAALAILQEIPNTELGRRFEETLKGSVEGLEVFPGKAPGYIRTSIACKGACDIEFARREAEGMQRANRYVAVDAMASGRSLTVLGVHANLDEDPDGELGAYDVMARLAELGKTMDEGSRIIVAGDMNSGDYRKKEEGAEFRWLRSGYRQLSSGFALDACSGRPTTIYGDHIDEEGASRQGKPIDHILIPQGVTSTLARIKHYRELSDHLPAYCDIAF